MSPISNISETHLENGAALRAAINIAQQASRVPMAYFRNPLTAESKADESPVTIADRQTEKFIREQLAQTFPADGIIGEEFGSTNDDRKSVWIVDPIDGTRSFLSGYPMFGMLLGRLINGKPEVGVVAMPALGEIIAGAAGLGTTLNGVVVTTRKTSRLSKAILHLNDLNTLHRRHPRLMPKLMAAPSTLRLGHDCYPHALVAAGHVDAVVDLGLQPYDYLPLVPVIEAAGGLITDWKGCPLTLKSDGHVVTAATNELHEELLSILASG